MAAILFVSQLSADPLSSMRPKKCAVAAKGEPRLRIAGHHKKLTGLLYGTLCGLRMVTYSPVCARADDGIALRGARLSLLTSSAQAA